MKNKNERDSIIFKTLINSSGGSSFMNLIEEMKHEYQNQLIFFHFELIPKKEIMFYWEHL